MRLILLLNIMLLLVVGCNSEYAQLSAINKTRIKVTATLPSGVTADKIMLWGQNANGNQFARVIEADDEETFIFDNGAVTLYAIAWTAGGLIGDVYCATQPNTLSGPDINLNLQLLNANCNVPHFNNGLSSTLPVTLGQAKVEWCDALTNISGASDKCSDDLADPSRKEARGHAMSYRYVLKTFDKTKNNYSFRNDDITSTCYPGFPDSSWPLGGLASSAASQIPSGNGTTTPFYLTLETFPGSTGCDDSTHGKISVPFQNGLIKNSATSKYFAEGGANHKLFVRMSGSEICNATTNAQTFAGGIGSRNAPFLICNPTQFYNTHTNRISSFKLMSDIDLTPYYYGITSLPNIPNGLSCLEKGSNFLPLGYDTGSCSYSGEGFYTGDFDGGGKTIKGLKILMPDSYLVGLYTRKYGGEFRRLKLESANIKGFSNVGALAGETQTSFRNISLDKSVIEATGSNVGGIAGSNTSHPNNCAFTNILITKSTITGNLGYVGGIISSSNSCDFSTSSVSGYVQSRRSGNVGGIAGAVANGSVEEVSVEGVVKGYSNVGGIAGSLYETRIMYSKVVGNVWVTQTGAGGNAGGLIGFTNGTPNGSTALVFSNYFFGQITQFCVASPASDCAIGNIVGDPGSWGSADFNTNYYLSATSTIGKSPISSGSGRTNASFYNVAATFGSPFIKTGDLPRLSHEVYTGTMDMRHPCQTISLAYASLADQVAAGKGNSADNPVSLCHFNQVNDMQSDPIYMSKFYKVLSPVVMTSPLALSLNEFSGQIDGDFNPIIRMTLYGAIGFNTSWWKTISANAVIKNLYFYDTRIVDNGPSATTSLLAETNNGTIDRVYTAGTISIPLNGGEHALMVHTNNGTIKNSYVSGSSTITNRMAGVAYLNNGIIEDTILNNQFSCTSGTNCFKVSGVTNKNTGTIRRIDISTEIIDSTGTIGGSDFNFVTTYNDGLIEDVQIQPTSNITSKAYAAHGIARENSATGIIRRIFSEGVVTVYNANLPFIAPFASFGDIDFIEGASGGVGFSFPGGAVDYIAYTRMGRWSFPSQYGFVSRTPSIASCQYVLSGDLPAAWETKMTTAPYYARFGLMVNTQEAPFFLIGTPTFNAGADDTFLVDDASPCSMTAGNPTVYFWPYDFRNGADLISNSQRLNFATFSSWAGAYNITTDDSVYHNYKYNEARGLSGTKPVWIFDTTKSMRLAR